MLRLLRKAETQKYTAPEYLKIGKTSQNERKCPFKAFCFQGGNFTLFIQKRHTERFCALSVDLGSGNANGSGLLIITNIRNL